MGLFGLFSGLTREQKSAMKRMKADHQDPNKGRVFCILGMSYVVDPAYLTDHAKTAIREWYGITSDSDLVGRIEDYLRPGSNCVAYDAFRAAFLARAGEGAGTLTPDRSWQLAIRAVGEVQGAYASWQEYGQGYVVGHTNYRKGQGDDAERIATMQASKMRTIAELSAGVWAQFPLR